MTASQQGNNVAALLPVFHCCSEQTQSSASAAPTALQMQQQLQLQQTPTLPT